MHLRGAAALSARIEELLSQERAIPPEQLLRAFELLGYERRTDAWIDDRGYLRRTRLQMGVAAHPGLTLDMRIFDFNADITVDAPKDFIDAPTPTPTLALSGTDMPIQPGGVIEPGAAHDPYSTLPPTSGPRYAKPGPWGVHDEQIDDEAIVRSLEVGAVVFNHNLESEAEVRDLRRFVEELPRYPGCYVVHPYGGVSAGRVTLTAWGRIQEVAGVDRFLMRTFVDDHVNQAPQFLGPWCGYQS